MNAKPQLTHKTFITIITIKTLYEIRGRGDKQQTYKTIKTDRG
jgi:hypothetical protein